MTWTAEQQKQLDALVAAKTAHENANRALVARVVDDVYFYNMGEERLTSELIRHADRVIAALIPFSTDGWVK